MVNFCRQILSSCSPDCDGGQLRFNNSATNRHSGVLSLSVISFLSLRELTLMYLCVFINYNNSITYLLVFPLLYIFTCKCSTLICPLDVSMYHLIPLKIISIF